MAGADSRKAHRQQRKASACLSAEYRAGGFRACTVIQKRAGYPDENVGTGPHRDDFLFMVGNVDIRKFGSQGQQRTAALSLKLAEIELVRQSIGGEPVLLLDDVLSELDSSRQNYLLDCIKDIQTVITCTGLDEFVNHRFNIDRIFKVTDGTVDFVNEVVG